MEGCLTTGHSIAKRMTYFMLIGQLKHLGGGSAEHACSVQVLIFALTCCILKCAAQKHFVLISKNGYACCHGDNDSADSWFRQ